MSQVGRKLKYIIVLSSARRDQSGNFPDFEQDRQDPEKRIYLGGGVRMRALLEAAKLYPDSEFVVVGGYEKEGKNLFSKAEEMASFMRTSFHDLDLKVINSLPSTRGNLVALFNSLKGQIEKGNFVLLSSDYHTARISEFWKQLRETNYPDLPDPEFLTISELGLKEATEEDSPEYLLRLQREREGLDLLRNGRGYKNSEASRINIEDLLSSVDLKELLTPKEFVNLSKCSLKEK